MRLKERLAVAGHGWGTKDLFWIACSWDVSPISRGLWVRGRGGGRVKTEVT